MAASCACTLAGADHVPTQWAIPVYRLLLASLCADLLRLLVGHLKPGGRLAVFDYQESAVSDQ